MIIELTNSQRLAVIVLIAEYERARRDLDKPQASGSGCARLPGAFIDSSVTPPIVTKLQELLPLFMAARPNAMEDQNGVQKPPDEAK